jgi:transposase InsO family protein
MDNQTTRQVVSLRTDNSSEFISTALSSLLRKRGIANLFFAPYSPQSNGFAERHGQTVLSQIRVLLQDSGFPENL